jgi:predicted  nucleic acid-binding Zn-ribbon protein
LSEQNEFEKLKAKHAELEAESHSLKEEQKKMENEVLVLKERIAVEELKNSNGATRKAISNLESKKNELETKLKQVVQTPETPQSEEKMAPELGATPEPPAEAAQESAEAASEELDDTVTVTAIDDGSLEEQEAVGEGLKRQQERKKHRFF